MSTNKTRKTAAPAPAPASAAAAPAPASPLAGALAVWHTAANARMGAAAGAAAPAQGSTMQASPLANALAAGRTAASGGAYVAPVRTILPPGVGYAGGMGNYHNFTLAPQWLTACPARPGTYRAQFWHLLQAGSGGQCSNVTAQCKIVSWAYFMQAAASGHLVLTNAVHGKRLIVGPGGRGPVSYAE